MTDLQVKLDWFAFTFSITLLGDKDNEQTLRHVTTSLSLHTGGRFDQLFKGTLWEFVPSAGFYTHSIKHPTVHARINWRAGNPYAQFVLSGEACDVVLRSLTPAVLAEAANGRCTRIDLAVDIETSVTPAEFCAFRDSSRFTTVSYTKSPTGETSYIGSRQGERMARVYRFDPPHPRAHLLRCEVELKSDASKVVCEAMKSTPLTVLAQQAHLPFGWGHSIWKSGELMVSRLPARYYDSEGAGRLKWIEEVVRPALKKAYADGLIQLPRWLNDLLDEITR